MASRTTTKQLHAPPRITTHRRIVGAAVLAGAIVLAALPPAAPAAATAVESRRDGDVVHIEARALLDADMATAWRVLTDYERYVEFIPDLRVCRVVARNGSTVTVEQSGDASWLFKWPLDITFEIVESPPNRLQSRAVAGSLRSLVSHYELSADGSMTRLHYDGDIDVGWVLFGRLEQAAVQRNVARQFAALADEIERQASRRPARPAAGAK